MWRPKLMSVPTADEALPGRAEPLIVEPTHFISGAIITGECPDDQNEVLLGLGCFWGAERAFWALPGVVSTSVGYGGGHTHNPTYQEVCGGMTAHTELVRVRYREDAISLVDILKVFWEKHDPTQGMRQGNDVGTQYRSAIYVYSDACLAMAEQTKHHYQKKLTAAGLPDITTEIGIHQSYYLAETYHQQYLAKNPGGYCGLGGCSVNYDD